MGGALAVPGTTDGAARANLGGLHPLLIQCGTDDLLAPDAEKLAVRAAAADVDVTYSHWPGLWHDFALQPDIPPRATTPLPRLHRMSRASWRRTARTGEIALTVGAWGGHDHRRSSRGSEGPGPLTVRQPA